MVEILQIFVAFSEYMKAKLDLIKNLRHKYFEKKKTKKILNTLICFKHLQQEMLKLLNLVFVNRKHFDVLSMS